MPKPIITLHGLDTIYDKIKDWLQERPIENDLMDQQIVLNGWPYVNAAYPLLEQSLKALVREKDADYDPRRDSHSLKAVWQRLKDDDEITKRLRKGYTAFQSLHIYVSYRTLDEFIEHIDNDYVKWRYYLLDGWENGESAKTSVEAMLEVARQALDVLAGLVATDHGFRSVGARLEFKVRNALARHVNADYQQGMTDALNAWLKEHDGSALNGLATILRHGQRPVRYQFEAPLSDVMENLVKDLSEDRDGDTRQWLSRVLRHPQPLVWDRRKGIFHYSSGPGG